ncbi:MAG: CDP-alcohol phosphatidyltransferase family protein [Longimicrobiales bacterium]|nr:CDP-alcohol phosphatidyltransferase family protein [Longimicrobiales bacterium]
MRRRLTHFFSDRYVQKVEGNALLYWMYRLAYPFAVLLNRLSLRPNHITTLSLICAIFAAYRLATVSGWAGFCTLWGLAVLLDFCDGTVARMTDRVSSTAFRYDTMSDLLKIALLMLGTGIRYQDQSVWGAALLTTFLITASYVLSRERSLLARLHDLNTDGREDAAPAGSPADAVEDPFGNRAPIIRWIARRERLLNTARSTLSVLAAIRGVVLTYHGHTFLVFLILPFGAEAVLAALFYVMLLSLLAVRANIAGLIAMRRI